MLPPDFIDQLKAIYPKRDGGQVWPAVARLVPCYVQPEEWDTVVRGTKNYALYCKRKGQLGTDFVMMARTFYGRDRHWEEYASMDLRTPLEVASENAKAALVSRAARIGFRAPMEGEPAFRYQDALLEAERAAEPRPMPKFGVVR